MSRRPLRATAAIAIPLGFTATLTVALLVGQGNRAVVLFDDTVSFALALYATACAVLAARAAQDRLRRTWMTMAVALGAWSLGDGLWLVYDLVPGVEPTTPSAADVFYLLFAALLVAAFAQLITTATHQGRLRLLLDAITVALCLFLLAWVLVLNSVYNTYREDRAALAVAFLYPVFDMIALTIAVVVLVRAEARQRAMLAVLTLAVTLMSIADSAFAHLTAGDRYSTGDLVDVLWAASLTAFAAAAVLSREAHEPRTVVALPSTTSLWLPYVPLLLAGHHRSSVGDVRGRAVSRTRRRGRGLCPAGDLGVGEQAVAGGGGRAGVAGPADRAGQPFVVLRSTGPRDGAAGARRPVDCCGLTGSRRFQARQRHARASRGRQCARGRRPAHRRVHPPG